MQVGIEIALHQRVYHSLRPSHEVVDTLLWPVGIVDFQAITLLAYVVADGPQTVGSSPCQQCRRLLVAVDALAYEVVGAVVANLQNGIRHGVGEHYKLARIVLCHRRAVMAVQKKGCSQSSANEDEQRRRKSLFVHVFLGGA